MIVRMILVTCLSADEGLSMMLRLVSGFCSNKCFVVGPPFLLRRHLSAALSQGEFNDTWIANRVSLLSWASGYLAEKLEAIRALRSVPV